MIYEAVRKDLGDAPDVGTGQGLLDAGMNGWTDMAGLGLPGNGSAWSWIARE